jgi:anti-anti-sigma regulatory factor
MAAPAPQLLLATCEGAACFRVLGKPSLDLSGRLREAASGLVSAGHVRIVVDLTACPSVDSTFIGVLLFLTKLTGRLPAPGRVILLAPCELVQHQLDSLGVLNRFDRVDRNEAGLDFSAVPVDSAGKEATTRVCLQAHQDLIEASAANAAKFKDVVEYLQNDLRRLTGTKPS